MEPVAVMTTRRRGDEGNEAGELGWTEEGNETGESKRERGDDCYNGRQIRVENLGSETNRWRSKQGAGGSDD